MSDDVVKHEEFRGTIPYFIGDQMYSNAAVWTFGNTDALNAEFGSNGRLYGCICVQILKVFDDGRVLAVVAEKLDEDKKWVLNTRADLIDIEVRKRTEERRKQKEAEAAKKEAEEMELKRLAEIGRTVKKKMVEADALPSKERKVMAKAIAMASDPEINKVAQTMLTGLELGPEKLHDLLGRIGRANADVLERFFTEQETVSYPSAGHQES